LNIDNIETSIQYCKEKVVLEELKQLVTQIKKSSCHLIIVSNELGLGIVPANTLSRIYRDLVGRANQFLALEADQVILTWAGIPIQIKPTLERLE
jgi:adenosylcobinamide kinase/adenosylcobinamide-phosphate guanylyltransferase